MIDKNVMIACLSTGRSGTTLLSNLFDLVEEVDVSHQVKGSRIINIMGNAAIHNLYPKKNLSSFLVNRFGDGIKPDSTTDPLRAVPVSICLLTSKIKAEVKIIHLVRDPRGFVSSFMNWKRSSIKRIFLHHFIPLWQPSPWLAGDVSFRDSIRMSKFEHFCWIWNYKNTFFKNSFYDYENYFFLRFEDIIKENNNNTAIVSLLDFLEIDTHKSILLEQTKEKVNKSEKNFFSSWPEWTPNQAKILDKWCGELMLEIGYGNEPKWKELIDG